MKIWNRTVCWRQSFRICELLFAEYQQAIEGKYTDSEDYIDLYMGKIKSSELIAQSSIWVYGFDSFAPKAMEVLGNLMAAAREVNVFLTCDRNCRDEELFVLPEIVMSNLCRQAEAFGVPHKCKKVEQGDGFDCKKNNPAISHLECELYAVTKTHFAGEEISGQGEIPGEESRITLVQAKQIFTVRRNPRLLIFCIFCGIKGFGAGILQ